MFSKEKLIKLAPLQLQNLAITLFNTYQYKVRRGGDYSIFKDFYLKADKLTKTELEKAIELKRQSFFKYIKENSVWYKDYNFSEFEKLPLLEKDDLIKNLDLIKTVNEKEGIVSHTGGTTGASMKVIYSKSNMQERFAILDSFREKHGYVLGKKTAWFSGKNLITNRDIRNGNCSHYDYINKIRFYSTFHINLDNFNVYWRSLNNFKPEFIVGFPSSLYEICEIADSMGLKSDFKVKIFFPTAETVLPIHRNIIEKVLGCKVIDQYASSEGAPHILECEAGRLHIHPLTGIFEVVDENMKNSNQGELLVTSFTTKGTPLVRYRIGDYIKLPQSDYTCDCGSIFPIVESIEGRATDYILSPTQGKVNLGNLSNSTKNVNGIIKFQIIQKTAFNVQILVEITSQFDEVEQNKFIKALSERLGNEMIVAIEIVDNIPKESSGKFRIVKNLMSNN